MAVTKVRHLKRPNILVLSQTAKRQNEMETTSLEHVSPKIAIQYNSSICTWSLALWRKIVVLVIVVIVMIVLVVIIVVVVLVVVLVIGVGAEVIRSRSRTSNRGRGRTRSRSKLVAGPGGAVAGPGRAPTDKKHRNTPFLMTTSRKRWS